MNKLATKIGMVFGLGFSFLVQTPNAAVDLGTYKNCTATDADFVLNQLVSIPPHTDEGNGGLKFAFVDNGDTNNADVYYIQKLGSVNRYNGKTGKIDQLGTIPVDGYKEHGLVGIAIPSDFSTSKSIYFMYCFQESIVPEAYSYRISQFKLSSDLSRIDLTTEKILIKIPREKEWWHTAGDMLFDSYGDLWIAIGDNCKITKGPANTADLRGGILRIHPDNSIKGYSIPAGNFGPHLSEFFKAKGNTVLAADYLDTNKVKPEIYVKGTRNAYTIYVDPVKRWLAWGDVGPDQGKISEEYNLVKEPLYMGWPYFAGEEVMGGVNVYGVNIKTTAPEAPINDDTSIKGVSQLPPVRQPIFKRKEGCAMTGPIFHYDGSIKNKGQMPPQLNDKWMLSGCDGYGFHIATINADGDSIVQEKQIFQNLQSTSADDATKLVNLKQGPDGQLYLMSWNNGLFRVSYKGACKDAALGVALRPLARSYLTHASWLKVDSRSVNVSSAGFHEVQVLNMQGKVVFEKKGIGEGKYSFAEIHGQGIYQIRAKTSEGLVVKNFTLGGL